MGSAGESKLCEVCGNPVAAGSALCPYCGQPAGHRRRASAKAAYKTVNLKGDFPTVEECLQRLNAQIYQARVEGVRAVKFIHGYGSSGVGGALRQAVREALWTLQHQRRIRDVVHGEDLPVRKGELVRRLAPLKNDKDLARPNPGVTLVFLE